MTIPKRINDLFEHRFSHILLQIPPLPHITQQISPCRQLNHKQYMLLRLKVLIKLDDIPVVRPFQNHHFLLHFSDLTVLRKVCLINRLDRHHTLSQQMQR